jgi:hypothetical protein
MVNKNFKKIDNMKDPEKVKKLIKYNNHILEDICVIFRDNIKEEEFKNSNFQIPYYFFPD